MVAPWKIRSLAAENLVGYRRLEWDPVHPDLNLLVGQNGVGKSFLLETLVASLNYLQGRHSRDTFMGRLPSVAIEIRLFGDTRARRFTTADISALQGTHQTDFECRILQVVENRQPKNKFGREGPPHTSNPLMRYPDSLVRLQRILRSQADEDIAFAETVRAYCLRLDPVASVAEWHRILQDIRERTPSATRPVSCGQFDVLALVVDLVAFQRDVLTDPKPHYLVVDNLETYLHPAAVGPMLDLYRYALPAGQFFVAAHGLSGLLHPRRRSVFFLPRAARGEPVARIGPIQYAPGSVRNAFLEIYGPAEGAEFLETVGELACPEYHRFLTDCVRECQAKGRRTPAADRQMQHAVGIVPSEHAIILDVGAGHGDLLAALESTEDRGPFTYIAVDPERQEKLSERFSEAITRRVITPESTIHRELDEVRANCDIAVLLNLCHHLDVPVLAGTFARLLSGLVRRAQGCGLVVVELRTLATGEQDFILWTPQDLRTLFDPWPDLSVVRRALDGDYPEEGHEGATVVWTRDPTTAPPSPAQLADRLWSMLPEKRITLLHEIETLRQGGARRGIGEYWRQKRLAFCVASLAWIARAEWRRDNTWRAALAPRPAAW